MNRYLFCFILLVFMSCGYSTHMIQTGSKVYEMTNASDIKFYSEKPNRPYTIIGSVAADVAGNASSASKKLKEEAAKIGADAVIYVKISLLNTNGSRTGVNGVAIKFSE